MLWKIVDHLKDPQLVAVVQEYYGVKINKTCSDRVALGKGHEQGTKGNGVNCTATLRKCRSNNQFQHQQEEKKNCFINKVNEDVGNNGCLLDNDDYETLSSESETESKEYTITNWMWYYVFVLGTALGDEIFYASFIPFWFWNIDGAVGRRVVLVWTVVMYIGQGIKDIVRWPRPACPPVVRLQKKWALEYGMPSTHAMVGISIPFSVILYTMNRYQV